MPATMGIRTPGAADFPAAAELVIVGGGIVGAATAFYATRAGLKPLVIECRPGLATLTTPRSLEAVRAQFDQADDVAMMRESLDVFENFADVIGLPGYDVSLRQQGYLFVTLELDGRRRLEKRVADQHGWGLRDVEFLDGLEARRRFPFLSEDVVAASFRGRDGWLATHEATHGFAAASGAPFFLETALTGFKLRSGRIQAVTTTRGRIVTDQVVVAAGPYAPRVAALAGVDVPAVVVRRHRAGIREHALIPATAPMTLSFDTGAHWRPEGPGAYLGWGGALDEPPAEPREDVPVDWTFPALALDAVARFTPLFARVAETLSRSALTLQAGQYTLTPDARPLIGRTSVEGLYLNAGYSGHGVMGSPGGARLLVDVILGRHAGAANPFDPTRFRGRAPGAVQAKPY